MQERGLISLDDDPPSPPPPLPTPPQKMMLHHPQSLASSPAARAPQQQHQGYRNVHQLSLPITAVNQQQQQPNDIRKTLPTQSLLKSSLLAPLSSSSLSTSFSSSTKKTMQYQETKRQDQQQVNASELPIHQYKSILHTHLMSKQSSPSSTSTTTNCFNSTLTSSSSVAGNISLMSTSAPSPNHLQDMLPHTHSQQYPLLTKQHHYPMQGLTPQQHKKTLTSSTMTATLLPHFVISTSSTTNKGCNSINSNNNLSKSNSYCNTDVSNSLSYSSLSSNKNNNVNSFPKSSSTSYHAKTPTTTHQTATTATATTQTQTDDMGDDGNTSSRGNPSGHLQMVPSSSCDLGSIIVSNASGVDSMAGGGTLPSHGPPHHHEAVTVVVFKTMLPDD